MLAVYANLSESRRRAIRHGLAIAGVLAAEWMYLVVGDRTWAKPAADGFVYWGVNISAPYAGSTVGSLSRLPLGSGESLLTSSMWFVLTLGNGPSPNVPWHGTNHPYPLPSETNVE